MPLASVGNAQPSFSPSNKSHSSGNLGPSAVVMYQIRVTSAHRIDSRFRSGCSQATSSSVITNSYSQTRGFRSHGSKMATRRQKLKNPATDQPYASPSTIIHAPIATKRIDTISVRSLIRQIVLRLRTRGKEFSISCGDFGKHDGA